MKKYKGCKECGFAEVYACVNEECPAMRRTIKERIKEIYVFAISKIAKWLMGDPRDF